MLVAGASDDCPIFFVRLAWHLGQVSCVVDMGKPPTRTTSVPTTIAQMLGVRPI